MSCVRISSNVTTTPPRVWVPSPSLLLWSILPEDLRGLHAGKQAECGKAFRPVSCLAGQYRAGHFSHTFLLSIGLSLQTAQP
jgi:hypothetical protein